MEDLGTGPFLELEELWGGPEELKQIVQDMESISVVGQGRIIGGEPSPSNDSNPMPVFGDGLGPDEPPRTRPERGAQVCVGA